MFTKGHKINVGRKLSEERRINLYLFNKGKILSDETKRKISETRKRLGIKSPTAGIQRSDETKKKISETRKRLGYKAPSTLGMKLSKEARKNISEGHMGEKNHNWQGGKSFEPYTFEWTKTLRLAIRQRDNFTCKKCGITEEEHIKRTGRVLSVNHIDFDKSNCDPKNLNTLCCGCNSVINFNREYWTKVFKQLI